MIVSRFDNKYVTQLVVEIDFTLASSPAAYHSRCINAFAPHYILTSVHALCISVFADVAITIVPLI